MSRSWGKCVTERQKDRQTDGQMNRTDFLGSLLQRWRFDHVFQKFVNKIFLNYLAWLLAILKESIQNRFCPLSKKTLTHPVLEWQYEAGWNNQNLMKNTYVPFLLPFAVLLHQVLHQQIYYHFLQIFGSSFNIVWNNIFVTIFSLLTDLT